MENSYFSKKPITVSGTPVPVSGNPSVNIPHNLVRSDETGDKVFLVEGGNIIHWIMNPEALQAVNGDFADVVNLKRDVFKDLVLGERITLENAAKYRLPDKEKVVAEAEAPLVVEQPKNEFKTYQEPTHNLIEKKDLLSVIGVIKGSNPEGLNIIQEQMKEFKQLMGTSNFELIVVVNGADIQHNDMRLNFAQKVIVNKEEKSKTEAVQQGVRVSEGVYKLIIF